MERFPDMQALAGADTQDVLHAWQGLGYYSRARNLQAGVREALERYGGKLPRTRSEVESLTGVGSYTAGALLSIVNNQAEPAVDGNVLRVVSRLFCLQESVSSAAGRNLVSKLVREIISPDRPGDFNQAIMDLGSSVCGRKPRCPACPLVEDCAACRNGCQDVLPVKAKKSPPKPVLMLAGVVRNQARRLYLRKRPSKGLLAGMWEFPTVEQTGEDAAALQAWYSNNGQTVGSLQYWRSLQHEFSHRIWNLHIYRGWGEGNNQALPEDGCWLTLEEIAAVPLGKPHRTIYEWLGSATLF
jgi:A/G-specific adenine glycosylase